MSHILFLILTTQSSQTNESKLKILNSFLQTFVVHFDNTSIYLKQ